MLRRFRRIFFTSTRKMLASVTFALFLCCALCHGSTATPHAPAQTSTAARGSNRTLDCGSAGQVLYIKSANLTNAKKDCSYNVHILVDGLCGRRPSCDLNPALHLKSTWFTWDQYYDTKCGNDTTLSVEWYCGPDNTGKYVTVAQSDVQPRLTCGANEKIVIRRAWHGYGWAMDDSTVTVRGICSTQPANNCSFFAWTDRFSDYDGRKDYEIIYYYCSPGDASALQYSYTPGLSTAALNCTDGQVLDIYSAYYGAGGYQGDESVFVKSKCQARNSCSYLVSDADLLDQNWRNQSTYHCLYVPRSLADRPFKRSVRIYERQVFTRISTPTTSQHSRRGFLDGVRPTEGAGRGQVWAISDLVQTLDTLSDPVAS